MSRRRITPLFVALILTFFFQSLVNAFTGTEGAAFLEIPIGARPAALGSAYSMLAEDAYAPVWNPAGLAFLETPQVAATHMLYLESSSYEFGSFVYPLGSHSGVGAAIQYFQPGTIAGLDANGNSIGDIHGYYGNYTLSFGHSFGQTVGIGISGNLIQGQIDHASGQAFAGGGGLLFRPNPQWRMSAVVANVGQKLSLLSEGDSLPLIYRVGAAYHPNVSWTFALEGAKQRDGLASLHSGIEYETPFGFTCRTGYNTETIRGLSPIAGFSLGLSMLIWNQDIAYTWLPLSDLGSSHLLSLVWHFGHSKERPEDASQMQRPSKEEEDDFNLSNTP